MHVSYQRPRNVTNLIRVKNSANRLFEPIAKKTPDDYRRMAQRLAELPILPMKASTTPGEVAERGVE